MLRHLIDKAEDYLDVKVDGAVIGIPARFTKPQRQAVHSAADLCGLEKVKILSEPELALRAYILSTSHPADAQPDFPPATESYSEEPH
eukprot:3902981-Amphidinium_carterae.1